MAKRFDDRSNRHAQPVPGDEKRHDENDNKVAKRPSDFARPRKAWAKPHCRDADGPQCRDHARDRKFALESRFDQFTGAGRWACEVWIGNVSQSLALTTTSTTEAISASHTGSALATVGFWDHFGDQGWRQRAVGCQLIHA